MKHTDKMIWNYTSVGEWLDCLFEDEDSGEEFFVELRKQEGQTMEDFIKACKAIADDNFDEATFCGLCTQETAEACGLDTY